ncbi:MAG: AIR synthase-related protein, partial [Bacteroidota bacterium]
QKTLSGLIRRGLVKSAHDLSEGGLAVALAECCIHNTLMPHGARVHVSSDLRTDFLLFGEDQSRILLTVADSDLRVSEGFLREANLPFQVIGEVGGSYLEINGAIKLPISQVADAYHNSLERSVLTFTS